LKELMLRLVGRADGRTERPSMVDLRMREQQAEAAAEEALNNLRAVREAYDPRLGVDRRRRLEALDERVVERRARVAALKGSLANG
jgi:hypothetical protein